MAAAVTVNDLLVGHVPLDVQWMDRIYLNGYVPNLQVGGQVVRFMRDHLGYRIPSPAVMEKLVQPDPVVLLHQGRPAGEVLLLLPVGRRLPRATSWYWSWPTVRG